MSKWSASRPLGPNAGGDTTPVAYGTSGPIAYRAARTADIPFVVSNWLRSHHTGSDEFCSVPLDRYKPEQQAIVLRALERGKTVVACDPRVPSVLFGFACGQDDGGVGLLHYAFVDLDRRKEGIALTLVGEVSEACGRAMVAYSHVTRAGVYFCRRLGLQSDPFARVRMAHAIREATRRRARETKSA